MLNLLQFIHIYKGYHQGPGISPPSGRLNQLFVLPNNTSINEKQGARRRDPGKTMMKEYDILDVVQERIITDDHYYKWLSSSNS